MRISDWSSDVCSSDLQRVVRSHVERNQILWCQLEALAELGDIGADDEHVLGTGDQHATQFGIGGQCRDRLGELRHRPAIELVDRFALAIEAELTETIAKRLHADTASPLDGLHPYGSASGRGRV